MTKTWLILFILWFCVPFAFGNGILVEQVGSPKITCKPGGVATVVFRIENQTSHAIKAKPFWTLPSGWVAVSESMPFSLPAGNATLKLLSIHVSVAAAAGVVSVRYDIEDLLRDEVSGSATLRLEVKEVTDIQLTYADGPELVLAGKEVHATFILQNTGNSGQEVTVTAQQCELMESGPFYLESGEIKALKVKAKTLATIQDEGNLLLRVYASLSDHPEVKSYAYQTVRVVPRAERQLINGHQIPVCFKLSHLVRQWKDGEVSHGVQAEFHAAGALDKAGENRLEVMLRGPNQFGMSAVGQYDEYYANFRNSKYYVHAGDKTFSLTPLTEFFRYGRGVEASFKAEGYEFGAFYLKPRFFPEIEEEAAACIRYQPSEGNQLSVNLMRKKYTRDRGDAVLASLHGFFQPWKHTKFEAEFSQGYRSAQWGNAVLARVNSQPLRRVNISSNIIYADKNYPGYFTNTLSFYGQMNYQASSKLSFSVLLNQDENNASRDTLFAVSPWSRLAQLGVNFNLGQSFSLRAFVRQNELKDRMPSLKFHFIDDVVRLQLVKNAANFQVSLTGEMGNRENLLKLPEDRLSRTYRSVFDLSYQLSQRHFVSGMAQYMRFDDHSGQQSQQWIFGGSVNSALSPYSQLQLAFQTNYQLEEYYSNRNLLDLNFSQKVGKKKNHELSVSANYTLLQRTQQQKDLSVQMNYTYHFGIRTTGKEVKQGIKGQITNAGVQSVEGIVLNLNGQSVKTGPDGSFSFENVPAGKHFLILDPTSVNLHELPDLPMPVDVTVEPGIDSWITFGLTRGMTVFGSIDVEPEKRQTKTEDRKDPKRAFIFEITNGQETFRRLTDSSNRFEFSDLRPGKWTMRILNNGSFDGFYFERNEWELELTPGDTKELNIKLLRKKREIKFQDKLSLTSNEK